MKIFAYCGSRNLESKTNEVVNLFIEQVKMLEKVETVTYNSKATDIHPCLGCTSCFSGKECVLDKRDNFNNIKSEMLSADVVILASPVYASTVSGDLKVFIDRISYLIHLMALRGKIGIPIITASTNSLIETNDYLDKIMNYLGAIVPFSILCTVDQPKQFDSQQFRVKKMAYYAMQTVSIYNNTSKFQVNRTQEIYYQIMKKHYINGKSAEALYWKKHDMTKYNTYQELLEDIKGVVHDC